MNQSTLAFGISRPSTLDEALNVIDRLSGAVATARARVIDAQEAPKHTREWNDTIDRLVRVRREIKAGNLNDALFEIERALAHLDSAWLCRA